MRNFIYVSQGRCAHLPKNKSENTLQLAGLVTDDFSICNIIAIESAVGITLMHADLRIQKKHLEEALAYHDGRRTKITLIRRDLPFAETIEHTMRSYDVLEMPDPLVLSPAENCSICLKLDDEIAPEGGMRVSANAYLYPSEKSIKNLLRHPKEYLMTAYLKVNHFFSPHTYPQKFTIFNGKCWEDIQGKELQWAKNILEYFVSRVMYPKSHFNEDDHFLLTAGKTGGVIEKFLQTRGLVLSGSNGDTLKNEAMTTGRIIYKIINKHNVVKMLRKDLTEILNGNSPSRQDITLKNALENTLEAPDPLSALIDFNWDQYVGTAYKENVREDLDERLIDFKNSAAALAHQEWIENQKKEVVSLNGQAMALYQTEAFKLAEALFRRSLEKAIEACEASDPLLASAMYNLASTLIKIEGSNPAEIRYLLDTGIILRKKYLAHDHPSIKKAEEKLKSLAPLTTGGEAARGSYSSRIFAAAGSGNGGGDGGGGRPLPARRYSFT